VAKPTDFFEPHTSGLPGRSDEERALLGICILFPEKRAAVRTILEHDAFRSSSHGRIFRAICAIEDSGAPVDFHTIEVELQKAGQLEAVGGAAYVESLTEGAVLRGYDEKYHAHQIKKACGLRLLIHSCSSTIDAAVSPGTDVETLLGDLQDRLLDILKGTDRKRACTSAEGISKMIEMLNRISSNDGEAVGLSTGLPDVDEMTTGIREGELWVLGGRPGHGKTSLGRQVAIEAAKAGEPVLFFSLEMSQEELHLCNVAAESGIPFFKLRTGTISKEERMRVVAAAGRLASLPLYIMDSGIVDVSEIVAHSLLMIRQCGIKLIIVDHLKLVRDASINGQDMRIQTGNIANRLRVLAKSTRVPVLLLSQLRRPKDASERPQLHWLMESGDIEAHAHTVILVYRPQENDGSPTGEDELIIAKNRFGALGLVTCYYHPTSLRFSSRDTVKR
jgi:replicative DNA helicase